MSETGPVQPKYEGRERRANALVQIIDKLTDPIEMAMSKIFSARFLMAVLVTYFACKLTFFVVEKHPDHAGAVITGFMTTWMAIVKDYFAFKDKEPEKNGKGQP
jgi:hypothetical protein